MEFPKKITFQGKSMLNNFTISEKWNFALERLNRGKPVTH